MKNKTLPALILSIAVIGGGGVITSITDAYAQTNTERLMTIGDTTSDTNSMVATIQTMLEDIQGTLNDIVSALTGLAGGQEAITDKYDAISASMAPLTEIHHDLDRESAEIQSKISEVTTMLSAVGTSLMDRINTLETNLADMQDADTDADLEAAINSINMAITNSQTATDERLSAFEQTINDRLTSIETRLGSVTEDVAAVSEQVETQATPVPASAAYKGTAKQPITLADYAKSVGEFDYNQDIKIDYNLKFECEETVYINNIEANLSPDARTDLTGTYMQVYLAFLNSATDSPSYTVSQSTILNPFDPSSQDSSTVSIPDIQSTSIVLIGEYKTVPPVQKPITLEAGDSFTIETSMANRINPNSNDQMGWVFFDHPNPTDVPHSDIRTLLDAKIRIDKDKIGVSPTLDGQVVFGVGNFGVNSNAVERLLQKNDNKPLSSLADLIEILEISVEWLGAVSDPKCTFTPIGDEVVAYPNQNKVLNVLATVENISLDATVSCNGQDTRIESIEDIKVGGDISEDNTEVGTLTLSAGDRSIKINLNDDAKTFSLDDDDADFPLEFKDTLQIDGTIVPGSTPALLVLEITYDTTAGNTCTQQQ